MMFNFALHHDWWQTPDSDGRPMLTRATIGHEICAISADQNSQGLWYASIVSSQYGRYTTPAEFPSKEVAGDVVCQRFLGLVFSASVVYMSRLDSVSAEIQKSLTTFGSQELDRASNG